MFNSTNKLRFAVSCLLLTAISLSAQITANFEPTSNHPTSYSTGSLTFNLTTGDSKIQNIVGYGAKASIAEHSSRSLIFQFAQTGGNQSQSQALVANFNIGSVRIFSTNISTIDNSTNPTADINIESHETVLVNVYAL